MGMILNLPFRHSVMPTDSERAKVVDWLPFELGLHFVELPIVGGFVLSELSPPERISPQRKFHSIKRLTLRKFHPEETVGRKPVFGVHAADLAPKRSAPERTLLHHEPECPSVVMPAR